MGRMQGNQNNLTENTIMDHHTDLNWISKEERIDMELYKRNILKRKIYRGGILAYRILMIGADVS